MKRTLKPKAGIRILSVILAFILTMSVIAGMLIADLRLATTKENAAKIIRETLFATHKTHISATVSGQGGYAPLRPRPQLSQPKLDEQSPGVMTDVLAEWLCESLEEQYGDQIAITPEQVVAFVEESTLKDEVSDLAASLINDFITGENTTTLDTETLEALIMENAPVIEKHFGITVSEDMVSGIVDSIDESGYIEQLQKDGIGGILLNATSGGNFGESIFGDGSDGSSGGSSNSTTPSTNPVADLLASFRQATSVGAIIACFGVAAVCAVALILLNLKHLWYALRKIGVSLIVAGLPATIPTVSALMGGELWTSSVITAVIAMILKITAPVCISVFAAGVVLTVVSIILKAQAKKKARLAVAAQEALEEAPAAPEVSEEPQIVEEIPAEESQTAEEAPVEESQEV